MTKSRKPSSTSPRNIDRCYKEAKRLTDLLPKGAVVNFRSDAFIESDRRSRGHQFELDVNEVELHPLYGALLPEIYADDREGPLAPQFAEAIREYARQLNEFADEIEAAGNGAKVA